MSDEHALGAELVTPEGARFSGAASGVVLRTADGDLTVLAGHTDLTGDVAPCVVRVERADRAEAEAALARATLRLDAAAGRTSVERQ